MARKADKGESKSAASEEKAEKNPEEKAPVEQNEQNEKKKDPDDVQTQPIGKHDVQTQPVGKHEELPEIQPPPPKAEPWPDATPQPMKPVEPSGPARSSRTETIAMSPITEVGTPPAMPSTTAPPPLLLGDVEDPTHMPGPKELPSGDPDDPAPPPGYVPPGDSRSLRRGSEFVLVYRLGTCVITRIGVVGTRGQWRVVEYPTYASASNSYAKECSRFVSEGFSDYRA